MRILPLIGAGTVVAMALTDVWAPVLPEKVKLSDPTQGTVHAIVLAIDEEIKQVKVQTEEGQRLMLFLDPESLARVHVGTPCLLQVANKATRDTARPPEHEGAFW